GHFASVGVFASPRCVASQTASHSSWLSCFAAPFPLPPPPVNASDSPAASPAATAAAAPTASHRFLVIASLQLGGREPEGPLPMELLVALPRARRRSAGRAYRSPSIRGCLQPRLRGRSRGTACP